MAQDSLLEGQEKVNNNKEKWCLNLVTIPICIYVVEHMKENDKIKQPEVLSKLESKKTSFIATYLSTFAAL